MEAGFYVEFSDRGCNGRPGSLDPPAG